MNHFLSFLSLMMSLALQLYAMPVFDMMETMLVKKLHFKPTRMLRFVVRNIYVGENRRISYSLFFVC